MKFICSKSDLLNGVFGFSDRFRGILSIAQICLDFNIEYLGL